MKAILALAGFAAALVAGGAEARAQSLQELQSLSIEQLSQIEITSVARHPEPISDTPAAVYVITSEDIRRSGALTLPEVLRLAPNLEVARQDAASYAISARGFNSF